MCVETTNRHVESQFNLRMALSRLSDDAAFHSTYTGLDGPHRHFRLALLAEPIGHCGARLERRLAH